MTQLIVADFFEGVATVTLSRPQALNAISRELLTELGDCFSKLMTNQDVHCVVIQGSGGKAFAAGADIASMRGLGMHEAQAYAKLGVDVFSQIDSFRCPVIASVDGYALGGGCELALACDFIYASDRSKFAQPEINLGLITGFGGSQRLVRRVGGAVASELLFTGRTIDADEAFRIGLVNKVHPVAEHERSVRELAKGIAAKPHHALEAMKSVIDKGEELALAQGTALETEAFGRCFETDDAKEGIAAFLEKRTPNFGGR